MRESLALAMIVAGAAIAGIGNIGALVGLVRLAQAIQGTAAGPTNRRIATFDALLLMLEFAAITAAGICLLLFGEVVGFGVVAWAPALPAALLIGIAAVAAYVRRLGIRERASR
jgi:hypothetical protein